jgi:hypothetical protein
MPRTQHSLTSLAATLLAPVTDAVFAETGRRLTMPQWSRIVRTVAARALRALAALVEPAPAPALTQQPEPQPAQTAPPVPVAPAVPVVSEEPAPVPFGWASLDLPSLMQEQREDRAAFGGEFPSEERVYGATAAQWAMMGAPLEPETAPEPAPVKPKATRKPRKPAAPKATAKAPSKPRKAPAKAKKPATAVEKVRAERKNKKTASV